MTVSVLGPRGSYSVQAGVLRHRVTIQEQVQAKDTVGGIDPTWKDFAVNVPAAIEDITGNERISSQQTNSVVTSAISIRWRPGVTQAMRVVHAPKGDAVRIYNIVDIQKDATGRKMMTMFCDTRDSDGYKADGR
jgi:SPP1 family predicted phage head-tail adaptor